MDYYYHKLLNLDDALEIRQRLLAEQKKLVFTNGCFDLLHPGHLRYLSDAKELGDFLMVALNTDASVRRLKGPLRPVRSELERVEMLSALLMVDGIILFDDDTPLNLIEALKPEILVKGGDWKPENIVGASQTLARNGQVKSLPLASGFSTSALIESILTSHQRK